MYRDCPTVAFGCFSIAKEREFRRRWWVWGQHRRWVGEELGRAVSLLLDDHVITKIVGTGEEKGEEKQAPGQDRAG